MPGNIFSLENNVITELKYTIITFLSIGFGEMGMP